MLKAMYFKNKHGDPLFLCFIFIFLSYDDLICKKLEKLNHNFNYTQTSVKTSTTTNASTSSILLLPVKFKFQFFQIILVSIWIYYFTTLL